MLYVWYGYGYGQRFLSVLCVHFVHILVRLLEAYGYEQKAAVPLKLWAQCRVVYPTVQARPAKHNKEEYFGKMELSEEGLCE